jgi:hypothetical protein
MFGRAFVDELGPREVKAFRRSLLELGSRPGPEQTTGEHAAAKARPISRGYINDLVATIARIIRWGVSEQVVPAAIGYAIAAVKPLGFGEGGREARSAPRPGDRTSGRDARGTRYRWIDQRWHPGL